MKKIGNMTIENIKIIEAISKDEYIQDIVYTYASANNVGMEDIEVQAQIESSKSILIMMQVAKDILVDMPLPLYIAAQFINNELILSDDETQLLLNAQPTGEYIN